jgi:predicted dithiol-disulfide oxidoreductase (DUF899 family)
MARVPLAKGPCPSCTALIDMWEGTMPHFEGLGGNLAVLAKAPIERVAALPSQSRSLYFVLTSAKSGGGPPITTLVCASAGGSS